MITYLVIGILIFTLTGYSAWTRDPEKMNSDFRNPFWWIVTFGCVLVWPIIVGWAIYDVIKLTKNGEES